MFTAYENLPDTTRVWVYQASAPFKTEDIPTIKEELKAFVDAWTSHNRNLKAHANLLHERFVVLMVDESSAGASGCSIDKSVYFLKQLQAKYGLNLFDRMRFSFKKDGEVHTVDKDTFAALYQKAEINDETPVFDTLVKSKEELDRQLVKPLGESWHKRMV